MREVVVTERGQPAEMVLQQRDAREPGAGEVRIRVKAAGVGYADVLAVEGRLPDGPATPFVPGREVSGYVEAVGPGPTRHEIGRHVLALMELGGYADTVIVPANFVFNAPTVLSHNEGATVPVAFLTAATALYRVANLKAGETTLIHNAGGGVGVAALQLARLRRATVIAAASPAKHNALRSLGVDHVVDSRDGELSRQVLEHTRGRGVDVIMDAGGAATVAASLDLLAPLGRLIIGTAGGCESGAPPDLAPAARTNRGVFCLDLASLWRERRFLHASMEALLTDFAAGRLKAVVAKAFPLARAADAHQFLRDRANVGKVVLTC